MRALAWLIDAPGLLDHQAPQWQGKVAALGANAGDAARDWLHGSPEGSWVSMAVVSDGSYDVPEGLGYSFPVTTRNGDWEIVQGLEIDEFSRGRMDATAAELIEERDAVTELDLI